VGIFKVLLVKVAAPDEPVTVKDVIRFVYAVLKFVKSEELKAPLLVADAVGIFKVITGVVVPVATVLETSVPVVPKVNAATEVTVPEVEDVPAPIAVLKVAASKAETVLSALNLGNVTAEGFTRVKILLPIVVAPKEVLPVDATKFVFPPSHCNLCV